MVQDPADYVWSNHRANAFWQRVKMWSPHEEYLALGNGEKRRLKAYQQLFVNKIGSEFITEIGHALNTGLVLGNDRFRTEVEKLTGNRKNT